MIALLVERNGNLSFHQVKGETKIMVFKIEIMKSDCVIADIEIGNQVFGG